MKIAIAADHGGYLLKEMIIGFLSNYDGVEVLDLGTNSTESVDYPQFGFACGEAVAGGDADRGIVVCGTGIGISIAANKVKGIRCALCTSVEMARLCRQHNDANILALGGRTTKTEDALMIVDTWLKTEFEGDRHARRVAMLDSYGADK
ncbi:MAG: ribose 5-phosphate isomerase B [Clostridiales bacterium]|nr:ribose 5-phosphate isomerase B [Clostridiales bacterium]